jgi:hypothetical protein
MNSNPPSEGRATLAHGYRNLSVREIRARLDGPLSDNERVTAKAELLRRGADDDGPDTTLATGFAPTSSIDIGLVESEMAPDAAEGEAVPSRAFWPMLIVLALGVAGAVGWAMHAKLIRV